MGTIHIAAKCLKKITFQNRRASIKILNKTVASRIATISREVILREASHGGVNMRLHVYVTEKPDPSGRRG